MSCCVLISLFPYVNPCPKGQWEFLPCQFLPFLIICAPLIQSSDILLQINSPLVAFSFPGFGLVWGFLFCLVWLVFCCCFMVWVVFCCWFFGRLLFCFLFWGFHLFVCFLEIKYGFLTKCILNKHQIIILGGYFMAKCFYIIRGKREWGGNKWEEVIGKRVCDEEDCVQHKMSRG